MFRHGPTCLEGPLSRTVGGWIEMKATAASSQGLNKSGPQPVGIRQDLVERVRREIANGSCETPEKWQVALDLLLERLQDVEADE